MILLNYPSPYIDHFDRFTADIEPRLLVSDGFPGFPASGFILDTTTEGGITIPVLYGSGVATHNFARIDVPFNDNLENFTFGCRMYGHAGLIFSAQPDYSSYYNLVYDSVSNIRLFKVQAGMATTVPGEFGPDGFNWYDINIRVLDGVITVYKGGANFNVPLELPPGFCAVYSFCGNAVGTYMPGLHQSVKLTLL